jgi:high affinity sulfate transporter 1
VSTTAALRRVLPVLVWLPAYQRSSLKPDVVAGLSVWALLVPQGLAYATLSGVPVQHGLYAAFAALVGYALFGSSRHVAEGPSAAVCAVCAVVITPLAGRSALGTEAAVPYAAALALVTGAVYLVLGALRMGWVSTFLSKAVMAGFVLGFSVGIIIDQVPKLLGVETPSGSYLQQLWGTLRELRETEAATLAVGGGSLLVLLVLRRWLPRWPRALIVMVLAIPTVKLLDLASHGVAVTGPVPTGLFSVGLPGLGWGEGGALLTGALSVVFVGYSESIAAARAMASKHGYDIDPNQELVAQGMSCGAAGLVGGFPVDGSLSKTSVAEAAGQRTQLASLVNAALVLLTLLFLAGLFEDLPGATLAAIVVDAMIALVSLRDMRRYFRVNRADWVFFMGAMVGILSVGIIAGVLIGVVLSLLLLVARSSRTSVRPLGRERESGDYHDADRYDGLESVPGIVVLRVDGPLFFADADRFRTRVQQLTRQREDLTGVVLDAEAIHLTDTDGADVVLQVARELGADGVTLALARVHPPVAALWRRAGLSDDVVAGTFESVAAAVATLQARAGRGTTA